MQNKKRKQANRSDGLLEGIGESLKRFGGSKEFLHKVLDTIPQAVFWKDTDLNYLGCNQLFAELAGKSSPEELIALSDFDMPWEREEAEFYRECDRRVLESGVAELGIIESQLNANGKLTWLETNKVPLFNDDGDIIGILGTYHDITPLKQAEETLLRNNEELERRVDERTRELRFVAHHDGLTGLANRIYFVQKLNAALESNDDERIALMFIDLDNFKPINDSDGHDAGDQLLTQVSSILRSSLGPSDFAGRFGGDEFLLLLRGLIEMQQAAQVCEEIRRRIRSQVKVNGQHTAVTASIGIVFCNPRDYSNSDDLLNDADLAMYVAKECGKNNFCFFTKSMRDSASASGSIEQQISEGIENDEFVLHFQPIANLYRGEIEGFESLVRWQHPQRGIVYPSEFISVAESNGAIIAMGQQVLESTCRQLARWQNEFGNRVKDLKMHFNLSPRQLLDPSFLEGLRSTVRKHGVKPSSLCLEITESLLLDDTQSTIKLLREIRGDGFYLYLDDFGTGYSSLNYLDELPVDGLKIDRSFVNKLENGSTDHAIIQMIVALAQTLQIDVIAEGVETLFQINTLKSMSCTLLQGYFFAKPMPAEHATQYLLEHHAAGSFQIPLLNAVAQLNAEAQQKIATKQSSQIS